MPLPPALQQLLDRIGGPRRAFILLVGLVTAGVIFGAAQWATRPTWVAAFGELPVESVGKMTDKLTEAAIDYRLERGGTEIQVKSADLAKSRVVLAREGLPSAGRPGLELFDQPSWGMTDFTQRINYRRALEGELERTIGKMRGVEGAQVHIALQEGTAFRRSDRPVEASVVLKLQSGQQPPADVVQGIAHLVASSVDGLESERVTIVDDAGRMLTMDGEDGSLAGLSTRQLAVQREVETHLERKAQQLVSQVVGASNARVQVAATINFDRVERTTQAVNPDQQAVATEQRAEITPGAQGGAASSNVATSYETTKSTETFAGAIGNVKRLTVAVLVNDRLLPPPANAPAGTPARSVPRTPAELARLDTLIRTAVGIDSARGDHLSVVNVAFDTALLPGMTPADTTKPDVWTRVRENQEIVVNGTALLAMVVVAILVLRALKPAGALAPSTQLALAGAGGPMALGAASHDAMYAAHGHAQPAMAPGADPATLQAPNPAVLIANPAAGKPQVVLREAENPLRDQAVATVEQRPEAAVRVIRSWLKDD